MSTRGVDRLETLRSILQVRFSGYVALAIARAPLLEASYLEGAFGFGYPDSRHLQTVRELGLDYEDLVIMAMSCADEVQLAPLQALFPDLFAEIEDNENPLREPDDGAADRAYDRQLDDQLGVL